MLLRRIRLELLADNYIQWLTIYEALNAVWKEAMLLHRLIREEAAGLAEVIAELAGLMRVLDPRGSELEIVERAHELGLTVYDASYVVLAEKA
ncbi:hypothetical protein [Hyperthermus butylicus]|uniref:PIN domain-containing protein n=1 Tax=Hyperthermus butylicus (strain DSM 5456 / JCM 9403 / PLM1-5) TaxID=415426 RepID=A2BKB3_HYPBU|nr:hypothetical protein [Hyperthermus butylicus]ABM80424.1 hypothetical protein Hbut_0564 [Hyperthermus butylicus DSM 5456]